MPRLMVSTTEVPVKSDACTRHLSSNPVHGAEVNNVEISACTDRILRAVAKAPLCFVEKSRGAPASFAPPLSPLRGASVTVGGSV